MDAASIQNINLEELILRGESEELEFKTPRLSPHILAKHLCAFANTKGGIIIVGIQEPDIIIGANEKNVRSILNHAQRFLEPQVAVNVSPITYQGKLLIILKIQQSLEIVLCKGQTIGRIGAMIRPLSSEAISIKLAATISKLSMDKVADAIVAQSERIEKLTDKLEEAHSLLKEAHSLKNKISNWIIAGIIGVILTIIATQLMETIAKPCTLSTASQNTHSTVLMRP